MAKHVTAISLIGIFGLIILHNPIFAVMCGGIILVIGIAGVTLIHAEAIVLSGNGFPRNNRIFVTLFHMPPSIIIVVILYPALNIVVADPSITEMEPKIYVNQYTIGGLNYRTCIECFDNESVWGQF
ncbi:hypothetical protein [Anaerobutyricum hallii]|uniref:hypothetical protein n=1 Tax=Anaerobutyricum hallii TaxID=39488 RepID=UPI00266FCCDF|nr:hypothetical protein [Anaerobutyricum hallii]